MFSSQPKLSFSALAADLDDLAAKATELHIALTLLHRFAGPEVLARLNREPAFAFDGIDLAKKAQALGEWCLNQAHTLAPIHQAWDEPPVLTSEPGFDGRSLPQGDIAWRG